MHYLFLRDGRRTFVKPHECQLLFAGLGSPLGKRLPRWGRERHSEHSVRAFTGVGAACQRPGAQRSRKAFRVLCGTGLDGS
jgi:hypothetical protein